MATRIQEDDMTLTFGSLFAGIGGLDLGFERAGMTCKWQVEIDDYCNKVLAKHWPNVARYRDVKEVHGSVAHAEKQCNASGNRQRRINEWREINNKERAEMGRRLGNGGEVLEARQSCPSCLPSVDVIVGGFPCQPHSVAGKQRGAADDRNLWPEYLRIVTELRPTWVVGENVPGIVTTYLDTVLSDLERADYEVATFNLPAVALDAQHRRERIFVVAYAEKPAIRPGLCTSEPGGERRRRSSSGNGKGGNVSDPHGERFQEQWQSITAEQKLAAIERGSRWPVEPDVGRVAHGVSNRVDRLRGLGNAVVPQVAEFIGQMLMDVHNEMPQLPR